MGKEKNKNKYTIIIITAIISRSRCTREYDDWADCGGLSNADRGDDQTVVIRHRKHIFNIASAEFPKTVIVTTTVRVPYSKIRSRVVISSAGQSRIQARIIRGPSLLPRAGTKRARDGEKDESYNNRDAGRLTSRRVSRPPDSTRISEICRPPSKRWTKQ